MEAGYGAAGHSDEQYGEQIAASYLEAHISGSYNCRMRSDNSHNCRDHHEIQQEAVQIISRLEQNPYRRNGRNTDVNKYKTNPEALGKVNRAYKADSDADSKQNHAYNGGNNQRRILSVNQDAENNGQRNEKDGCHGYGTIGSTLNRTGEYPGYPFAAGKAGGYDIRKCSDNQQQYKPCKNGEKHLAAMADVLLNNLSQGFSLMTDGYEDGAEVLNSPEENTADNNP